MKISYDQKADAMSIKFQEGKYEISEEVAEGVIIDLTKSGRVIAIEILDASKKIPLKDISQVNISMPITVVA